MAYGYSATITIDNTKVDDSDSADLSDFPVLVSGTYDGTGGEPDLRVVGSGGNIQNTDTGGNSGSITVPADLAFFSDSGGDNQLDHEVEYYSSTTGLIEVWVKVSTVDYNDDTTFYMKYGDSDVTSSQENVTGTWSEYTAVWHMNNDPSGTVYDSASTPANLTSSGSMVSGDMVAGNTARSVAFEESKTQYMETAASVSKLNITGAVTVESYVYSENILGDSTHEGIYQHGNYTGSYEIQQLQQVHKTVGFHWRAYDGSANNWNLYDNTDLSDTTWHHFASSYDGSTGVSIYIDGTEYTDSKVGTVQSVTSKSYIAVNDSTGTFNYLDGKIQELRIADDQKTDAWVITSKNSISSPSTFYTMGSEELGTLLQDIIGGGIIPFAR